MATAAAPAALAAASLLSIAVASAPAAEASSPPPSPPAASELLAGVANLYAAGSGYRDEGEIEIRSSAAAEPRHAGFETASGPDGFRFVLHEESRTRAVWEMAGGCRLYDSASAETRPCASLAGAIGRLLGGNGLDLLAVPALLAGTDAPLTGFVAAAVDGPEACGTGAECWVVAMARVGGATARLWVERSSHRVLKVGVNAAPGLGGEPKAGQRLIAVHRPQPADPPPTGEELTFRPPKKAVLGAGAAAADRAAPDEPIFGETIEVRLRTFVVRAVDDRGEPLRDLTAEQLEVTAGRGRERVEVPVVGVDWVAPDTGPPGGVPPQSAPPDGAPSTAGRPRRPGFLSPVFDREGRPLSDSPRAEQRIVLFVQSDPYPSRMRGQLKELPAARELLDALPAGDRVALVSFDSHLKLWQDFTHDRNAIYEALERAVRFGGNPSGRRTAGPGLGVAWDSRRARRIAGPEEALAMTAEALVDLPGEKVVLFLGWGLGRFDRGGVRLGRDYARAVRLLEQARASVFVLDISDSAFHTLELGLRAVAEQTGGTYAKTHTFARRESLRLARVVGGYYRVTVDASAVGDPQAEWSVELRDRGGTVLVRPGAASR